MQRKVKTRPLSRYASQGPEDIHFKVREDINKAQVMTIMNDFAYNAFIERHTENKGRVSTEICPFLSNIMGT